MEFIRASYNSVYENEDEEIGVNCACGLSLFYKRDTMVCGKNTFTCPICGFKGTLLHNESYNE